MHKTLPHIAIWTEELPPAFHWHPDTYLGGTPEFAVETAKALAKIGHEVTVYYDGVPYEVDDVTFLPRSYWLSKPEIVLHCNGEAPSYGTKNLYWTSLYNDKAEDHPNMDTCFTLSRFHKGLFGASVVLPLGVYPEELLQDKPKENIAIYTSAPDRGGQIIKEKQQEIEKETGWKLIFTYNQDYSNKEMNEIYKRAKIWTHPCTGVELFCQAAHKAQVAGCYPVYCPEMALKETVVYGKKTIPEYFVEDLIQEMKRLGSEEVTYGGKDYVIATWEEVAYTIMRYV